MLIYEVNLQIDVTIYNEYIIWLNSHIQQILNLPGFIKASLLTEENIISKATQNITVQYYLDSQEHLNNYLTKHAQQMRDEGLAKFNQKFTATRRIFTISAVFQSENKTYD